MQTDLIAVTDSIPPYLTDDFLAHHGILGMKWGVRRYQNSDGSLTSEGRIRYGSDSMRSITSKASSAVSSLRGKSFNDIKTDALDYANRKGLLDFLDSKANEPFSAIRSSLTDSDQSAKVDSFIDQYTSQSYNNIDKALGKLNRYSTMVTAMRKNEPYVKVEDTSKPWMETFKNGMMGWNHTGDIENTVRNRAADKYADFLNSESYKGISAVKAFGANFDDVVDKYIHAEKGYNYLNIEARNDPAQYVKSFEADYANTSSVKLTQSDAEKAFTKAAGDYIKALSKEGHLVKFEWDAPMNIETVDGLKINSVIYNNGGGVQRAVSSASAERYAKSAKEVQDFIAETGRLPTTTTSRSYATPNSYGINSNYVWKLHRDNIADWAFAHSDTLMHYGTKGQKWGRRQYQNHDGSLTPLGRVHYGVGEARNAAGRAASKVGSAVKSGASATKEAIRRKVKPTHEEIVEDYNKAAQKNYDKHLRNETRRLSGKHVKLKNMTDQEIVDAINRYRNEATLKQLEKESKTSPMMRSAEEAVRRGASEAINTTVRNSLSNLGNHISESFETKSDKTAREARQIENQKRIDDYKNGKSEKDAAADAWRAEAEMARNRKDAIKNNLEARAYSGDAAAQQRLKDVANANKGDKKNKGGSDDSQQSSEPKKKSDKQNSQNDEVKSATHTRNEVNTRNAGESFSNGNSTSSYSIVKSSEGSSESNSASSFIDTVKKNKW